MEAYSKAGGLQVAKSILETTGSQQQPPDPPPQQNGVPSWCVCRKCQLMPTEEENRCCRLRECVTLQPTFNTLVLDRDTLSVAIVGRMDLLADHSDFSNEGYRFAAYRQYVLWQNGYLGRGNRRVVPSCATCAIRAKYPSHDGVYKGYKPS